MPRSNNFDVINAPNIPGFQTNFDDLGWMTGSLDPYLWPISFDLGQEFDVFQNTAGVDTSSAQPPANVASIAHLPTPASDIADLYSRAHSPALDQDAVEVRQYHATRIELDAPLHFPDIDPASIMDAELENFAHVQPLPIEKVQAIIQLAEEVQREPHHPPFTNLIIPPQPILNAWVQLYFEYFHPVFPVLHKPTFLLPEVDPLLVLCVAGIGAQFSNLRNARGFAQSIHELVRRRASFQCEKQNQLGRIVWMTQVIMLNNLAMSHSGDRRELEIAEILQAVSIALARRKGVFEDVLPHDQIAKLQLPHEQAWRLWAVDEERRRTGFAVWLLDYSYPTDLTVAALRQIYRRLDDRELAAVAQKWKECSAHGRTTVYYAARLLETIRNNHATHYAMPIYLLRAVLTLWLYARLFDESSLTGFDTLLGATSTTNPNDIDVGQWILSGRSRIRLPGIADLLSPQGRRKLLAESVAAMNSLKSWGIVLLMLEELGLEYILKPIDLIKNELQFPGLLQSRDLSEKTPVVEIDGYVLFEARAICRFLAHKYQINPASLSLPTDTDALGVFEQAASVEAANNLDTDTDAIAAHGETELRRVLDYYENVLEKQSHLAGKASMPFP
ncbi:hypothetical protein E8E11_006407 [Didymella keratinophila]|nr:hypothetical protein E8E11_006407 [Didymella keratinophila]